MSLFLTGIFSAIGLFFIYLSWRFRRYFSDFSSEDVDRIRSITEEGLVEVEGEIIDAKTHTSPITQTASVVSGWHIKEWDEHGEDLSERWSFVAKGIVTTDFVISDGSDEITVQLPNVVTAKPMDKSFIDGSKMIEIDNLLFVFSEPWTYELQHPPNEEPDHIKKFVNSIGGLRMSSGSVMNKIDIGNKHGERQYFESLIEDGNEVYVRGEVVCDGDYGFNRDDAVIQQSTSGKTIISPQTKKDVKKELAVQSRISLCIAGFFFILAIASFFAPEQLFADLVNHLEQRSQDLYTILLYFSN
jgi:hypothetical protein